MSMIGSFIKPGKSDGIAADFVAFVADRESEQVLKNFVLDEAVPHTHIEEGGIEDAIARLSSMDRSPKLLLVDLQSSEMPLSDLARLASVCEPSVQVIALGERNDVGLYRSLLGIGVREYLVKPLTVGLLKRTMNLREGRAMPVSQERAGKVLSFVGARGGVGTTTIAINLACNLAHSRRRVVYLDLNLHGGAGPSMVGLTSNNGLLDVLQNVHRLDPAYLERAMQSVENSRLLLLSAQLEWGDDRRFGEAALGTVLDLLVSSFHYVILDIGERADPLAEEAFGRAARSYVVADRSVHAVRETVRLIRYIETCSTGRPVTSVLLNNPNMVTAGKVDPGDLEAAIGRPVLAEVPFERSALAIAENVGVPLAAGKSQAFEQMIVRLADDLTGNNQNTVVQTSLWQRLKSRM
ncbi:AAA family ATPase [Paraburkholderia lycopersici]|uniref:Pilus assembly protein CpaE n=1 Tax=Paraburkholderia lycopersici TaxID=416944 RepID=A0A1G6W071_9BURK|nr:AAA family ATPase [Paraburkholderia lycopersici]SDD59199.1 pilus assembly protein CpaE [Paraburkholderia lycopersici]